MPVVNILIMSATFCDTCKEILDRWDWEACGRGRYTSHVRKSSPDPYIFLEFHPSLSILQTSAATCDLCAIVLGQTTKRGSENRISELRYQDTSQLSIGTDYSGKTMDIYLGSKRYLIGKVWLYPFDRGKGYLPFLSLIDAMN